jgi:glycosyltransferase involved in cell wall biosynthesis
MARILVVTSAPPLTEGGHLVLARALVRALTDAGHDAGLLTTPSNRFGRQGAAYLANWLTDVGMTGGGARIDQVISLRFPSYAVRHPMHVCWLNHTMREYYDRWDAWASGLSPQGRVKETVRRTLIRAADTYCFKNHVRKLMTISGAVKDRLVRWNRLSAEVLHPPAPPREYRCDAYGDHFFFASRLTPLKRVDLVLKALAEPAARQVRCVIGGDGEDRARLTQLARDLGLDRRVTFLGHLSDSALVDRLAECRAVVFPPADEDYGFVTIEAFAARKAVITCTDSGGPLELVTPEATGLVVAPTPAALASAFARLMESTGLAETMGAAAAQVADRMSWPEAIRKLLIV